MKVFSIVLLILATVVVTSQGAKDPYFSCLSWRFGVETNNIIDWETAPEECREYVEDYLLGHSHQYRRDSKAVVDEALSYAQSLKLPRDGRSIWIFDVDETSISHLPFFAEHGFRSEEINETSLTEWFLEAKAPALPESLKLYKVLLSLGIKVVFLTGRPEALRNATAINLKKVGYYEWEKLILKASSYPTNSTQKEYKSNERRMLVETDGYRIVGNIGDQWSDIQGPFPGNRTFKLPNPMYYAP